MNFLKTAAIAAAVVATTPAMATDFDSVTIPVGVSGTFTTTYTYDTPFNGYLSAVLSSAQTVLQGSPVAATNVDFTSAVLTYGGKSYNLIANSTGIFENYSVSDIGTYDNTIATLTVSGVAGSKGAYTVSFSSISGAVPEASTWIMMILGFGITAAAMRKRQAPALAAA